MKSSKAHQTGPSRGRTVPLQKTQHYRKAENKIDEALVGTAKQVLHNSGKGGCSPFIKECLKAQYDPMCDSRYAVVPAVNSRAYPSGVTTLALSGNQPGRIPQGLIRSMRTTVTIASNVCTASGFENNVAYMYGSGLGEPFQDCPLIFSSSGSVQANVDVTKWNQALGTLAVNPEFPGRPVRPADHGIIQALLLGMTVRLVADQRAISEQQGEIIWGQFPGTAAFHQLPGTFSKAAGSVVAQPFSFESVIDEQVLVVTPSGVPFYPATADPILSSFGGTYVPGGAWFVMMNLDYNGAVAHTGLTFEIEQKVLYYGFDVTPEHKIIWCTFSWEMAKNARSTEDSNVITIADGTSSDRAADREAGYAEKRASALQVQSSHAGILDGFWGSLGKTATNAVLAGMRWYTGI